MIININSKKAKRSLCILLAAASITGVSAMAAPSMMVSAATSANSVSANSSANNVAFCLKNARPTSNKTYISTIQTNKANGRYNVWRAGDQLMSIQSSDPDVAKICSEGYNRYIRIGNGSKLGRATVVVKYKSGTTDKINVFFRNISSKSNINAGQSINFSYTGGKSPVKSVKVLSGGENASAVKNGKMFKVTGKKKGQTSVKVIYENNLVEHRVINVAEPVDPVKCEKLLTYSQFMNRGVVYYNNKRFTYYSQSVLPGYGLNIPGRHIQDGYVSDKDGYIVLASPNLSSYPRYSTIDTPFGRKGKFYDFCPGGSFDVYVQ